MSISNHRTPVRVLKDQPTLAERTRNAASVALEHAAAVDGNGAFPAAAISAMRQQRLLGLQVPRAFGGEEASVRDVVETCFTLGQSCASAALIFAMHQIKMACLVRHASNATHEHILRRIAAEQLLMASSTTEGETGGDVRTSEAAIEPDGDYVTLERKASVISYGSQADGIVTTARRSAHQPASNQVLVVLLKQDYTLEKERTWDTLGMRGTHSEGFTLRARATADHVLDTPYSRIHAETMVPFAHLTWSGVWLGIATAATAKAQLFIRHAMRKNNGHSPPGAPHFTTALSSLHTLRGVLGSALDRYEAIQHDPKALQSVDFHSLITLTKVQTSELAADIVMSALRACGIAGYRNDSEFSIGRHLRDILSAPLMINNDRILANLATPSLMTALPTSITDATS